MLIGATMRDETTAVLFWLIVGAIEIIAAHMLNCVSNTIRL